MRRRTLTKRNCGLEVRELPDNEMLVYDPEERVTHFLAPATAFIWERCDGTNSRSDLERIVRSELQVTEPAVAVQEALDRLDRFKLLIR